jgi:Arc/MetJ family transcription regulator
MALVRTNIVIDERLIRKAMRLYGLATKREAVDFALRRLVGQYTQRDMLDLEGIGWEADLDELRGDSVAEL